MRRKLKSRRGVTIVEMLVALILLSLLTAGGVSATTAVMADYNRMQDSANAEILASTAIEAISNEIRLGKNIKVLNEDGDEVTDPDVTGVSLQLEMSVFSGEKATLSLDAAGHLAAVSYDAVGNIIVPAKQMLSESAYSGLHLEKLEFKKVESGSGLPDGTETTGRTVFTISFSVYHDGGDDSEALWKGEVSAAPMIE